MAAILTLDDSATPVTLQRIAVGLKEAGYLDRMGQIHALNLELRLISTKIRDEIRELAGTADPELLIALWSSDQISHADGVEYARTGSSSKPDEIIFE